MHGYLINLDSEEQRLISSLQEAEKIPLEVVRIPAINRNLVNGNKYVTSGVAAAWQSHMKALRKFYSSGEAYCIIMEDDFGVKALKSLRQFLEGNEFLNYDLVQIGFLLPGIDTRVKKFLANLESLIFKFLGALMGYGFFGRHSDRMRIQIYRKTRLNLIADDCLPGAHFYIVGREFAASILELNDPQFLSIDDFYTSLSKMRTFRMARVRSSWVTQKPFPAWTGERFTRD